MATAAEYQQRLASIASTASKLTPIVQSIADRAASGAISDSRYVNTRQSVDQLFDFLDFWQGRLDADSDLSQAERDAIQNQILIVSEQVDSLNVQLINAGKSFQANRIRQEQGLEEEAQQEEQVRRESQPKVSTAEEAEQQKQAQQSQARETAPLPTPTQRTPNGSNASVPENLDDGDLADTGASAPRSVPPTTVTTGQTQQTPGSGRVAATAATEDAFSNQQPENGTVDESIPFIAPEYERDIEVRPNVLNQLTTSNYSISIYLQTQAEYGLLLRGQKKQITSQSLIMQTGGINAAQRNRHFDVDFYIEDVEIESLVGTQEVGQPHNAVTLNFKVVEPQGITFLSRLKNAALEHAQEFGYDSEFAMNYLMVIRFYGYDEAGRLISGSQLGIGEPGTNSDSLVEKYIPFQIANITYKIRSGATEYYVQALTPQSNTAFSTARATIPFNLLLTGSSLGEILDPATNGIAGAADVTSQDIDVGDQIDLEEAGALPDLLLESITGSLAGALNFHQQYLVTNNQQEVADIYKVKIENVPGLVDAQLVKPGRPDKKNAPNKNAKTASQKLNNNTINYNPNSRSWSVQAGTQIGQLLDIIVRSSTYITKQQTVKVDEKNPNQVEEQEPKTDIVQWYRIRCQIKPQQGGNGKFIFDAKRRDYAYEIIYVISRYQINTPLVQGFPRSRDRGVHKEYEYWFTGQNTEVLDFEIEVNTNYLTPINQASQVPTTVPPPNSPFPFKSAWMYPNATQQGGRNNSLVPAGNLASRLYTPVDIAYSEVEILGDPDWLQQSDIFYNDPNNIYLDNYMPDGSINYDSRESLYAIRFNPVSDYNAQTGLTPFFYDATETTGLSNTALERLIFTAVRVTNTFRNGAFTQKLKGFFRYFEDAEIDYDDLEDATDFTTADTQNTLPTSPTAAPVGSSTALAVPTESRQLKPNGSTSNWNVNKQLPFRDVQINGTLTRVYGTEEDLNRYYQYAGAQATVPKPGSTVVDDDAGTVVPKG